MVANLDMTNGRANIAFLGSRDDVWHRMGQEMAPGMGIAEWAKAAGLDWHAVKVPAIVDLRGAQFDHLAPEERAKPVKSRQFIVRSDNGFPLGYVSPTAYKPVQPADVLDWFAKYISVDDRFQLDVAGSLDSGKTIWATATFRDPLEVAGDRHVARVLMTTTFDGSGSTVNQGTMTRTVCENTLNISLNDKRAMIRTPHNARFDAARVGSELAQVAQGFATYKALGDALAQNAMAAAEVETFFKTCLGIPTEAKDADISGRKSNQFAAVADAFRTTQAEGATGAWAALNAITRYVDHSLKSDDTKRFNSAQFGSGAAMKAKAVALLLPRVADKVLIPA